MSWRTSFSHVLTVEATLVPYMFVTPFGIALGVICRTFFNAEAPSTILAIGVLDSVSAGVLLYGMHTRPHVYSFLLLNLCFQRRSYRPFSEGVLLWRYDGGERWT